MQILKIDSATTGAQSVSRKLTGMIAEHLMTQNPGATMVTRDLASDPLPHLDTTTTAAVRTSPDTHEGAVAEAYPDQRAVFDEFAASQIVIIGAPMYNFSIPSQLKAWLDRLGIPGVTFRYSDNGVEGLAGDSPSGKRRIIIASARGGEYGDDNAMDHQEALLKHFFGFIGVEEVRVIRLEKAGFGEEAIAEGLKAAKADIDAL